MQTPPKAMPNRDQIVLLAHDQGRQQEVLGDKHPR